MVFPNQVKRLNDLGRNSEQFLKHERDLLSLVGDFLDVSEDKFEIFWNGQVCNEGDGGVCCKKNYELTNGVVVKIKKDSFAPYHPDDQDHHDDHQILIIIIKMMIIIQMLMIICR